MIAATVQDRLAGNEPTREGTAIITVFAPVPVHLNVNKKIEVRPVAGECPMIARAREVMPELALATA